VDGRTYGWMDRWTDIETVLVDSEKSN